MSATTIQPPAASQSHAGASPESTGLALRANPGEGEPCYIALGALRLDERNARKDQPNEDEIEQLADLIDAQGLLQNLAVVAYEPPLRGKGRDRKRVYTHGVIAGGRRLRALERLVQRGRLTPAEEILCTVVAPERALAVSTAENSGREPMSTADTIIAFADMVKAGAGVEELAVCFHLSPLTVQRRLRLGNVSPALFAVFRDGVMTPDQLMALALTDDHAKQEAAWNGAPAHDRSPRRLRALIAGEGASSAVLRFVGLEGYEAAGGGVLRDLFSEGGDERAYILDPELMMRLASEKLDAVAQGLRAEGLPWVEQFLSFGYSEREQFAPPPTRRREPTNKEAAALAALEAEGDKVRAELEALCDSEDDSDECGAAIDRLEQRCDAIDAEISGIEDGLHVLAPEVAALAGALVYLDGSGNLKIERHWLRKADAVAAKRSKVKATDGTGEPAQPDAKGGVSDKLCHQLTAHRTRALQALLLADERAALGALAHPLLVRLVYDLGAQWESPSAIQVRTEDCERELEKWAPDLAASRADQTVRQALAEARAMLPESASELLPWLLEQPLDVVTRLLALCSALSLNAINGDGKQGGTEAIAGALGLRMADWWTPTVDGYLGSVSKAMIAAAVKEAGLADEARALEKQKKGEAAARAAKLLAGRGWVPVVLR